MSKQHVYSCINKRCPKKGQEVKTMAPAEYRATTGQFVRCSHCGEVLRWLRSESADNDTVR